MERAKKERYGVIAVLIVLTIFSISTEFDDTVMWYFFYGAIILYGFIPSGWNWRIKELGACTLRVERERERRERPVGRPGE